MTQPGTAGNPLRVAIIGAGPTGFYTAEHLLKQTNLSVEIDLFDRVPTPFGLVRAGVAPDHLKIKTVTAVFDKTATHPHVRFYGNVEIGKHLTVDELKMHYHQIVYTTGAQTDRRMDIPGEDLAGSHPATDFVAWYNGHPDYRDLQFDLSQEAAAVVGIGNVAIDVARILCRTPDELLKSDIADYALEALRHSRVRTVYVLGRRGPVQAAFSNPEIREVGEMADVDVIVPPAEVTLDPLSQAELDRNNDRTLFRKVEILQEYGRHEPTGKSRRLIFRFLVSPTALEGDETGHVKMMRLAHNKLVATDPATLRPKATGETEEIPVGLVFRSVGYRGVPVPGVPFKESWGVILNQKGRVLNPETQQPQVGEYTAGWIKRGPNGVIGTNKPDAVETVMCMLEDLAHGQTLTPTRPDVAALAELIEARQPDYFSYVDWQRLNEMELRRGQEQGRPRVKFTSVAEMLAALGRA
ncbi:MAG: FAD-dependent oxidoreductase [Anaerolineae bacterium]